MKFKRKLIKWAASLCVATVVFNACNDPSVDLQVEKYRNELEIEKADIGSKTQAEQYAYLTKHLDILRNGFLGVSRDEKFKANLYREINAKFDGDFNVLVKKITKDMPDIFDKAAHSPYIKDAAFEASLAAFTNIVDSAETINLYPQIFIPFFQELKETNKLSKGNPTLVSFSGDDSANSWMGVRLSSAGRIEQVTVDDNYMVNNEVWVLSINESVREDGELKKSEQIAIEEVKIRERSNADIVYPSCIATNMCDPASENWEHGKISKVKVICPKEQGISGLSEVTVHGYASFTNHRNPFNGGAVHVPDWIDDPDRRQVGKFGINGCATIDFNLFPEWRIAGAEPPNYYLVRGNLFFFNIFEYDAWPAPKRAAHANITEVVQSTEGGTQVITTSLSWEFRSTDTSYVVDVMNSKPEEACNDIVCIRRHPCQYRVNNSCMEMQFSTSNTL